ncbi:MULTISPECIES: WhiB family transcriptional regulator [Frankia]|uniref:Transcriptional regulator WhiB n=1 Tax=Frankia alni (strain DSM 45986 / CECT 9034 / ACN14a) TaxID=326424 RepID=Q0RIX0_FRAAA|nr:MULTISPECIES: WhiB family transcriptional regulator [Frankia]CAJ62545.1 Putative WhiB-related regulatory protein [Frankia alni ACN14a]
MPVSASTHRAWSPAADVPPLASWRSAGACGAGDLDLFFAPEGVPRRERTRREAAAKAVCAGCRVRRECLRYALRTGERFGVWGGLTEWERARIGKP